MMGAGIAYVSAAAGIEVVLKDVSLEAAERAYSARLLDKKVARGHLSAEARRLPRADRAEKVGVLGGMMGAGIAYVSAAAGIEVVLKDVSLEAAERAYSARLLDKKVARGHLRRARLTGQAAGQEARGHLSAEARRLPRADRAERQRSRLRRLRPDHRGGLEDRALKGKVTAEAEACPGRCGGGVQYIDPADHRAGPGGGAAGEVHRPALFSPVDKMPLVEIIRGEKTSDETLARGFDYVLQIKKTPIVVNDSRGFFTSRVFGTFTNEGIAMLGEGVSAAMIDNQARQAGMPVGPLAISDEVSLSLMTHIRNQTARDLEAEGKALPTHPRSP